VESSTDDRPNSGHGDEDAEPEQPSPSPETTRFSDQRLCIDVGSERLLLQERHRPSILPRMELIYLVP